MPRDPVTLPVCTCDRNGNYSGCSNALLYTLNSRCGAQTKAGGPAVTNAWYYDALECDVEWNAGNRERHFHYDLDQVVEHAEISDASEVSRKQQRAGRTVLVLTYIATSFG